MRASSPAAIVWFVRAQLAARSFDWSLAAASLARLRLGLARLGVDSDVRHLLRTGAAVGGLSEAAEAASRQYAICSPLHYRIYGDHALRKTGRVRSALPHRGEGTRSGYVPIRGLGAGTDLRSPHGAAGLCLCSDASTGFGRTGRRDAGLGAGARREDRRRAVPGAACRDPFFPTSCETGAETAAGRLPIPSRAALRQGRATGSKHLSKASSPPAATGHCCWSSSIQRSSGC